MIKNYHGTFPDMESYLTWCEVVGVTPEKIHIHKREEEPLLMNNNYDLIKRRRIRDADN